MKSDVKRKMLINNMVACGMVVVAYIIMQVPVGTGRMSSLMRRPFVPSYIYVVMAVSLNLTVDILGEPSLGHAGSICVGAFAGALFSECVKGAIDPTLGVVTAILIGVATAVLFGVIIRVPVLRLRGDYLTIMTPVSSEIIRNLVNAIYLGRNASSFYISSKDPISLRLGESGEILIKGAQGITGTPQAVTFIVGVILVLITLFIVINLVDSRTGHAITVIWDDRIATKSIDIDITKCKLLTFFISVELIGITGAPYVHNLTTLIVLSKNFGYNMSIMILVYMVLSGIGNIRGSVIVIVILHLLPEMLRGPSNYRMFMYTIMLILVMLFNSAPQFVVIREHLAEKSSKKDKKPAKEVV